MIKVFQITDIEWVASSDKQGAKEWLIDLLGEKEAIEQMEDNFYPLELSETDLNRYKYTDDTIIPHIKGTFASELWRMVCDQDVEFPCFFASSEC